MAIAYYLLKVTIISGLLFGYYHLALKDKVFHQWNRFYLLASVILSLTMPLISFTIHTSGPKENKIITALQVVSGADEMVAGYRPEAASIITPESILSFCFIVVSVIMIGVLLMAVTRIIGITRRYEMIRLDDIHFLNTREPGTPFSFFKYIFWNNDIDISTPNGKRIFEHEMVHVREYHSHDKIFLQLVLVAGWINPFFWMIRSELQMIHEFIADKKSIGEKDSAAFAELILQTTYPQYNYLLSNSFFQNSIKRRLTMINKSKHPGMNYLSRISALVMAACILLAFTLKPKKVVFNNAPINLEKKITVVIDAGHGGEDNGSHAGALLEKDINLQIASQVKSLNNSPNIEVILTRESDVFMNVREKLDFSIHHNADLFISIHVNAAPPVKENGVAMENSKSGFDAYISKSNTTLTEINMRLATILLQNMSKFYSTNNEINKRDRVWVLDENPVPAAILECGYITNDKDRAFMTNAANQKQIAENILKSIEQYFSTDVSVTNLPADREKYTIQTTTDTVPKKTTPAKKTATAFEKTVTPVSPTIAPTKVTPAEAAKTVSPAVSPTNISTVEPTTPANPTVSPTNVTVEPKKITLAKATGGTVSPTKVSTTNVSTSVSTNVAVESDINTSVNNNTQSNVSTSINNEVNTVNSTSIKNHQSAKTITSKNTTNSQSTNVNSDHQGVISVSSTSPGSQIQIKANQGNTGDSSLQLKITGPEPLFVLDKIVTKRSLLFMMDPKKISSIEVIKGFQATKEYGENGKNGVVRITTKK